MQQAGIKLSSVYVRVAGRKMHARVAVRKADQRAPQIILVHGLGVSSRHMVPLALRLAPYCSVYAPDLPGFGKSANPSMALDVPGMADALEEWMEASGVQSAVFIGNSLGCQVIVDLAVRYPERVQKAVLTGPTFDMATRTSMWTLVKRVLADVRREPLSLFPVILGDYLSAGTWRVLRTLRYGRQDPVEHKLPYMKVPTLLVRGEHDSIAPLAWLRTMATFLPVSKIVEIQGAAHAVNFAAPGKLAKLLLAFLDYPTQS